jgi:hypothetical protein
VHPRSVSIQPPMDPTLVVPDPSPPVEAYNIAASDDELFLACLQSMQSKHASLASETALSMGNIIIQAPHATNVERGDPPSYIQLIYETALVRNMSTPPLRAVLPIIPSWTSSRLKSKITSQFSLGRIASFVANLKGQASASNLHV